MSNVEIVKVSTKPSIRMGEMSVAARGEADAPDIDGRVFVRGVFRTGEFAQVKVVGHTDYDLIAEPNLTPGTPN